MAKNKQVKLMKQLRYALILLGFACLMCMTCLSFAEEAAEANAVEQVEQNIVEQNAEDSWYFFVYASQEYRFRIADSDEQDHTLNFQLDFMATDPSDRFTFDLSMSLFCDINGRDIPASKPSAFASYFDHDDTNLLFEVYKLSADYHTDGVIKLFRGGRQVTEIGSAVVFDGATISLMAVNPQLEFTVFAGRTVHFYEIGADIFEDWIASGALTIRPVQDLKIELDYRFTRNDILSNGTDSVDDHVLSFRAWYRYHDWLYLKGFASYLNDEFSEVGGAARFDWLAQEAFLDLNLKAQTTTLSTVSESDDPYFAAVGESKPHIKFSSDLYKGFTTKAGLYGLHLGYDGRFLTEGHSEDAFNRNFGKVYFLATAYDIASKGIFLTAIFERWGDGIGLSDDGLWAFGGSVGYEIKVLRAELGTYYQRYKYSYYMDLKESADVQTYYVDISGKPIKWLKLKARYEFEKYELDVHTFTVGLSQTF